MKHTSSLLLLAIALVAAVKAQQLVPCPPHGTCCAKHASFITRCAHDEACRKLREKCHKIGIKPKLYESHIVPKERCEFALKSCLEAAKTSVCLLKFQDKKCCNQTTFRSWMAALCRKKLCRTRPCSSHSFCSIKSIPKPICPMEHTTGWSG